MKTSTAILIAVGGIAGIYLVSKFVASSSPTAAAAAARARSQQSSSSLSSVGQFLGGLIGGAFTSHGAGSPNSGAAQLSAGDKAIFDTVTDKSTGAVDLSSVYDNSGIVDTIGDMPG